MTRLNKCFFLLLCLAAVQAFAQSPAINRSAADEIETLLNTNAVTYSQAVRFVLEAADLAEIADPGEAFQYAKEQNLLPAKSRAGRGGYIGKYFFYFNEVFQNKRRNTLYNFQ